MEETKECPLCGERMRLITRTQVDRIPGQSQTLKKEIREWTCPECDYYEDENESISDEGWRPR